MRVLYLTYDGLTSLIGQSQVWPYLKGLAADGHRFDVISFERPDRLARVGEAVAADVAASGIAWHPRRFRAHPPILAKALDQRELRATAEQIARSGGFDAVHARSYVAADAALAVKRRYGLPFIFDMRGFWADQRREGGRWPPSNPFYRFLYRRWKAKEAEFIANADWIIVLAEAARGVVRSLPCYRGQPVTAIPCCVDHRAFAPRGPAARTAARARLPIGSGATVVAYLGSLGTVYLLPAMLRFFDRLRRARPGAVFLFIGNHSSEELIAAGRDAGVALGAGDIRVQAAEHGEVAGWLAAADLGLCLIAPTPSSLGVSPTKLAEYLACGLPVVVNEGVGDVGAIVRRLGAGAVLPDLSEGAFDRVIAGLGELLAIDPGRLRERSRELHDLPVALERYRGVYDRFALRRTEPVP